MDDRIERQIREAFSGAIAKDSERVSVAVQGLSRADTAVAVGLVLYVCGYVVTDIYRGLPSRRDLAGLAEKIVSKESDWIEVGDAAAVARFLEAAAKGDTALAGLSGEDVTGLSIVCGAYLLAYYRLDGQRWYRYLDEIWAALEATPEPG